jgi:gag-polypeptide of LTR copia-type
VNRFETVAAYEVMNRNAMQILIPSIVELEFQLIRNYESAREIWQTFEANFRDVSLWHQCNTFEQLILLKYQPDKTIHDHIMAFNKLYREIKMFPHLTPCR